uniref:Uncharacterized protein n=1 Tax=Tetranychus urticae TaxID=32264 RepID=T1JUC7_TETUR
MQKILWNSQDYCYSSIVSAHFLITRELYPEFINISLTLSGIKNVPDMKLRTLLRVFLKPFISNFLSNDIDTFEKPFSPFVKQLLPVLFARIDISMKLIQTKL